MTLLLAALVGFISPFQTGINSKLRSRVGSPFGAALISFIVGAAFLLVVTPIIEHDLILLTDASRNAPWWIWFGGCLGPVFVVGNILFLPIIGSTQTAIIPKSTHIWDRWWTPLLKLLLSLLSPDPFC